MQEDINKRSPFCSLQNGNNRGSICVQACNNSLMTWEKGNELFHCELYEDALSAYYKTDETWPWVRTLRKGSRIAQNPSSNSASKKSTQLLQQMSRWFFQLY